LIDARAHFVQIDDVRPFLKAVEKAAIRRNRRNVERRPVPARSQFEPIVVAGHEQDASRAVGHIGNRLDRALGQGCIGIGPLTHRAGEPHPFLAVIVAVLEQVFRGNDTQGLPQPLRRQPYNCRQQGQHQQQCLADPGNVPAQQRKRPRGEQHGEDIA